MMINMNRAPFSFMLFWGVPKTLPKLGDSLWGLRHFPIVGAAEILIHCWFKSCPPNETRIDPDP
jgi:hypothetical protein